MDLLRAEKTQNVCLFLKRGQCVQLFFQHDDHNFTLPHPNETKKKYYHHFCSSQENKLLKSPILIIEDTVGLTIKLH